MRYWVQGAILLLPVAFVVLPIWEKQDKLNSKSTPAAEGFGLVADKCEFEMRAMAHEFDQPWVEGSAELYCICMSVELLAPLDSETKILESAQALTSNTEVFRGFMRLESIVRACMK